MNQEELQVAAFEIILNSGNARATVHEAFSEMREGHYAEAEEKLELANTELVEAHRAQTKLLQDYASGIEMKMEIIIDVYKRQETHQLWILKMIKEQILQIRQNLDFY